MISDLSLQWLITTPIYNIGEHAYHLSQNYKAAHDKIPWALISGLRHRLVHDYEDTNWNIIADVVFDDIPRLIEELRIIMTEEGRG